MQDENINRFHEWYNDTIEVLQSNDENIKQWMRGKKEHTSRVCENIQQIGKSIGLSENDLRLAEAIALFHDVGRFYQYLKYKTIIDFIEPIKDHAELGIVVLENYKVLDVLSQEEKDIILKSIKYHNLYELPNRENERVLLFSKLIRDAGKLDIYKVHVKYFEDKSEYHKFILKTFPDIPKYTSENIQAILNNRCPENAYIKTYNDLKLTYIAWIFDINFHYTMKQIIDNKYIDRLIAVLPDTEDINKVHSHVSQYIDKKIQLLV